MVDIWYLWELVFIHILKSFVKLKHNIWRSFLCQPYCDTGHALTFHNWITNYFTPSFSELSHFMLIFFQELPMLGYTVHICTLRIDEKKIVLAMFLLDSIGH
jgi:hypothetical protein